jgi:UDP-glucuronate decarboxylase
MADKKNILVVGGAGFLGSFLCEQLIKEGRQVICADDLSNSRLDNIAHLLKVPEFEFVRANVTEGLDLEKLPELARFRLATHGLKEVYFLPATTTSKRFEERRIETAKTLSVGLFNILDLAVSYGARFFLGSTAAVYGPRPSDNHPLREDEFGAMNHLTPRACKDMGRRWAETVAYTYKLEHNLDVRIARIFRTFGPRMPLGDGQLIPDFILGALDGRDLTVFGDDFSRISLVYVTDVIDAMLRLMREADNPGIVNVGNDYEVRIVDVARKIIELTGSSSRIAFTEQGAERIQRGLPDLSLAKQALGWVPLVTLEQGLRHSIQYAITEQHKSPGLGE